MSSRPARPTAQHLDLTPAQIRIAQRVAEGKATPAIASDLSITGGTINVQMKHCGQKLGVKGRAAVVHACYVTEQLKRPPGTVAPGAFSDAETETWRMIAIGADSKDYADRARISRDEALKRMRGLRDRTQAKNDPHLVTLGWAYGVLDESLVEMLSGAVLTVAARI
ncbi:MULTISPECIES: helix-turn-helix domain-containing protein [Streptomyces]|uniref:helix-turn-helix domain-containing protein n=1 Tax=Streptomyces scabiei TaxID=1930 RepID=UPI001B31114A|nr:MULTISPECIES: helix-turn-helix transcriptional regulator [Streptomyces]MDX3121591.1 helix-turn-helix transcriptional regulator [Streptomyces scabiei]MDX3520395.1 helix-turn-helix transcriptional regulator [Streptomyces scabiei]